MIFLRELRHRVHVAAILLGDRRVRGSDRLAIELMAGEAVAASSAASSHRRADPVRPSDVRRPGAASAGAPSFRYSAVTITRSAGMRPSSSEPSSRSVTRAAYLIGAPGKKNVRLPPATSMSTCGGSLPGDDLHALRRSRAPFASVTASDAVYTPGCAKVNVGLGSVSVRTTAPFGPVIVHW